MAMNGVLAEEFHPGSGLPDANALEGFYRSLGRDPGASSLRYPEILAGMSRLSMETVEAASQYHSLFGNEEIGGMAWIVAASVGTLHAFEVATLSGQALVMGKNSFEAVKGK